MHIFGPKKVFSTKKVLFHAQNPNFQLSLGFCYLDWPNPESLVTIGQTDLSPQILGPKIEKLGKKKYHLGKTLKIRETLRVQLRKCHKDKICCPKVCHRQTNRQSQILNWSWEYLKYGGSQNEKIFATKLKKLHGISS